MNAALEREDDIKRHNQSRVFSEILGRGLDGFRNFLGTSLAPKQWQQSKTVLVASSPILQPATQADDLAEEGALEPQLRWHRKKPRLFDPHCGDALPT